MGIKEFVKTLNPNKVYYVNFKYADTWATIYSNMLIFEDGSYNTIDKDICLFDNDTIIYNGDEAGEFECCKLSNQIYPDPNPMPELEDGMFVKCRYNYDNEEGYEDYIGFVFKGTVIFQSGKFSMHAIKENRIIEIYNSIVRCFNQCTDYNIAWRKYND